MKDKNLPLWISAIVIVLILLVSFGMFGLGASGYGFGGMMGMIYGNYGYGMMFFGWLYGILILIALTLFIVFLVKQIRKK